MEIWAGFATRRQGQRPRQSLANSKTQKFGDVDKNEGENNLAVGVQRSNHPMSPRASFRLRQGDQIVGEQSTGEWIGQRRLKFAIIPRHTVHKSDQRCIRSRSIDRKKQLLRFYGIEPCTWGKSHGSDVGDSVVVGVKTFRRNSLQTVVVPKLPNPICR